MIEQLIPIIYAKKMNNSLSTKNSNPSKIDIPTDLEEMDIGYIEDDYKSTLDSKNRLEDKAKTIVAALTIAITLILNLSKVTEVIIEKNHLPYISFAMSF